jgi:hypothetical protein
MSNGSTARLILLLTALSIAAVAGWLALGTQQPSAEARTVRANAPSERALAREVASLRRELAEERARREDLAAEIETIWAELEAGTVRTTARAGGTAETPLSPAPEPPSPNQPRGEARDALADRGWFNEDELVASGFAEERAAWLRERFEELQIEELYLRDEAHREGWARTPRLHREIGSLRAEVRKEIGDEAYDALLFGAGRPNRVLASDVLRSSPAAEAGIQAGDVVFRYDGQAIFSGLDLRSATVAGKAGASVPVDVLRNGETHRFYIPRGPLGLRLRPVRRAPEPTG